MQAIINKQQLSYLLNQALTNPEEIECSDAMEAFLEDLGKLVADHFGGKFEEVMIDDDGFDDRIVINLDDDSVPEDGGIYKSALGIHKTSTNSKFNLKCYDAGEEVVDRYTIIHIDDMIRMTADGALYSAWAASANPFHPLGFGQHTEAMIGNHLGQEVEFSQLPEDVQRFVAQDLTS